MFLKLAHTNLETFKCSKQLVLSCYALTKLFPEMERYILVQQVRRAALSIHLNVAEGCSRKSIQERKRFFEIARGSIIEVDTCLDIAFELKYCSLKEMGSTGHLLVNAFKMLSGMISK